MLMLVAITAIAILLAVGCAEDTTNDRDYRPSRTTTEDRPSRPATPRRATPSTIMTRAEADRLLNAAILRSIRCDNQASHSQTECARRALNAVCEDRYGDAGWATAEEYACRDEVRAAARRR